jgi:ABC-type polysaccharide/polyol phosphate export permease
MSSALVRDVKEMLREQYEYRELLFQMVKRDLLVRYKQSVMFGWAIFMPLLNTAVFSIIFTRVAPIETPVPYPLYAYCGLWAWNLFASSLKFSVGSLTSNPNLVSKVYFPREIFPFSAVIVSLVDSLVAASVLVGLMVYYGVSPTGAIVWLPVVVLVHLAFTAAVGLILSLANLFYRDVKYLFEIILTVWMFMTSVLYPLDAIDGALATVVRLNPMTPIIDAYRAALLGVPMPDVTGFAVASLVAVMLLAWSWVVFHRSEFEFAENI